MSAELNELKLQLERLTYESKEAAITAEATKEQNSDLTAELEELRKSLAEVKAAQKSVSNEGKEKKKAEKLAQLMGTFDTVRRRDAIPFQNPEFCVGCRFGEGRTDPRHAGKTR